MVFLHAKCEQQLLYGNPVYEQQLVQQQMGNTRGGLRETIRAGARREKHGYGEAHLIYGYSNMWLYMWTYGYMRTWLFKDVCFLCIHTYICIYTCTYMYIHRNICIHICVFRKTSYVWVHIYTGLLYVCRPFWLTVVACV